MPRNWNVRRRWMSTGGTTWLVSLLSLSVWLTSLSGCASPPAPCNCSLQEAALTHYTSKYLDTLQDVGALREALKICEERAH